MCKDLSET